VTAADSAEFVIRLTVGPGYTAGPSRLIVDFPGTVSMSRPTRMHQEESGYLEAYIDNPAIRYTLRTWDMDTQDFPARTRAGWRGTSARLAVLDLGPGCRTGDTIEIHWGDTGRGFGGGARVTHVVPRRNYRCSIHVRYFTSHDTGLPDLGRSFDGYERPVPNAQVVLSFAVRPREPHHLRLIRRQDRALLAVHDRHWNVCDLTSVAAVARVSGRPRRNAFGLFEFRDRHVRVRSRGLPLTATPDMTGAFDGYEIYWGDIHTHSAFSVDCIEREKMDMGPGDLMAFARERAGLDFFAVTDHHQPWDTPRCQIGRAPWEATMEAVQRHNRQGRFVVLPGIEYRCRRGDTVVAFNWLPHYDEIARPEWTDVRAVWAGLAGRDFLTIPHFHLGGGLAQGEWWEQTGGGVEPVLEIFSCHGSYEREDALEHHIPLCKNSRPDRYGAHFLKAGLRYGLVCNSDGHKGHVGMNGLTAVFARSLDAASILDAYRQRRVYGTTNARIRLVFTGNGSLMGSVVPNTARKTLGIDVVGENALKKVELFRNAEPWRLIAPARRSNVCREDIVVDDPAPSHWYVRVTQVDNQIAWSSPVWFA